MKIYYYLWSLLLLCTACKEPKVTKINPLAQDTLSEVEPTIFQKGQWADKIALELMQIGELPASSNGIRIITTKERHTYELQMSRNAAIKESLILTTRTDLYTKDGYVLRNKDGQNMGFLDFDKTDNGDDIMICNYTISQEPFFQEGKVVYIQIPLAVERIPQKYYAEGYYHVFDTSQTLVADEVELFGDGDVKNMPSYTTFEMATIWTNIILFSLKDSTSQHQSFILEDTDKGFELFEFIPTDEVVEGAQKGRRIWTFKRMKMYED